MQTILPTYSAYYAEYPDSWYYEDGIQPNIVLEII